MKFILTCALLAAGAFSITPPPRSPKVATAPLAPAPSKNTKRPEGTPELPPKAQANITQPAKPAHSIPEPKTHTGESASESKEQTLNNSTTPSTSDSSLNTTTSVSTPAVTADFQTTPMTISPDNAPVVSPVTTNTTTSDSVAVFTDTTTTTTTTTATSSP